jgi:hypothetical protein
MRRDRDGDAPIGSGEADSMRTAMEAAIAMAERFARPLQRTGYTLGRGLLRNPSGCWRDQVRWRASMGLVARRTASKRGTSAAARRLRVMTAAVR